jgi:hypothetical protein
VDTLAVSVQFPGPRSGTSTDSKPGPSDPESSPLKAFAFDIGSTGFTFEVVTREEFVSTDDVVLVVVFVVFAVTITGVDGVVVGTVVVDVAGASVVTGDVEEGGATKPRGRAVSTRSG